MEMNTPEEQVLGRQLMVTYFDWCLAVYDNKKPIVDLSNPTEDELHAYTQSMVPATAAFQTISESANGKSISNFVHSVTATFYQLVWHNLLVATMLSMGRSPKQIAEQLYNGGPTVQSQPQSTRSN